MAYRAPGGQEAPDVVRKFAARNGLRLLAEAECDAVLGLVHRSLPALVIFGAPLDEAAIAACRILKQDTFSAVIPVIVMTDTADVLALRAMEAGADELLTGDMSVEEQRIRLEVTLSRADRDVSVHPSTRLPGTAQIERDITDRIGSGDPFAVCYADLDHFKEFNDRYGYNHGDDVISLTARILRDVVRAYSPTGFIGHIGGDDFIFNVPLEDMEICCQEILSIFDELIPWQYTEEDRERGSFLAKDRRGNVHPIPIMSLSIGVVTNGTRVFSHPAKVSELASEMKSYAKTLEGSIYAVDRRSDDPEATELAGAQQDHTPVVEKP